MKRKASLFLICGGILLPLLRPPDIFGGIPIGLPAQEMTQLMNYGELIKHLIQGAQQLQQLMSQVQYAIYNTKNLASHPFTSIMGDLNSLGIIISQSQGLAYTAGAIDKQFAAMYPSYDPRGDWFSAYANWSSNTLKTLNGTLSSAGLQGANLMNEQATLQQLRAMTATPMGMNQALQIGAIGTQEMISQLIKLRQLLIVDSQAKAAAAGYQMNQDQVKHVAPTRAFPGTAFRGNGEAFGTELTGTANPPGDTGNTGDN